MTRRFVVCIALAASAMGRLDAQSPALPSDAEVRQILVDRIDRDHQSLGIVVGLVGSTGRRVIAYGALDKGDSRPLNGDTIFEIGSVTKVFTSLLLADMAARNEVALNDPIAKYLPSDVKVPGRNGQSITLQDLATHTSGLPRLPTNFNPKDPANPYADFSVPQLYEFLSTYTLSRDIGSQYDYSNLGGGLLGHLLARRAGMTYDELVHARITGPLGMMSTTIVLSPEQRGRLAVGHNAQLASVPNWDLPTLAGAGALRSSTNDMLTFLEANLGLMKSPLAAAMATMLTARRHTGTPGLDIALGWHIINRNGRDFVWHNGGTGGYRSFVGYNASAAIAVVVLSNTSTVVGVDDIGLHLLDSGSPLVQPAKAHIEVAVNATLLDGYVGRYQLAPNFVLTITRDGDHLFVQATNQPRFELFAEGDKDYFLKVVEAGVTFVTDDQGRATAVALRQNGANVTGKRIE
jgi:D-alanyl-D-alanine-carboxypeptidase/D-alanyl-D-alanine-endopeptidase